MCYQPTEGKSFHSKAGIGSRQQKSPTTLHTSMHTRRLPSLEGSAPLHGERCLNTVTFQSPASLPSNTSHFTNSYFLEGGCRDRVWGWGWQSIGAGHCYEDSCLVPYSPGIRFILWSGGCCLR